MPKLFLIKAFRWPRFAALVVLFLLGNYSAVLSKSAVPSFPHSAIQILRSDGQSVSLDVEVATTPPQHAYGLMFRQSLSDKSGMLFVWGEAQNVSMWMKNTYIPLDMLFIRSDGTIAKIIAETVPLDLTPLSSDDPVRGVIEINGGEAEKLGIAVGDRVIFSAFHRSN